MGMTYRNLICVLLLGIGALAVADVAAQVPEANADALIAFDRAVALFEAADYDPAVVSFQSVAADYPLHTRTTAAMLMAGKALYRSGRFEEAKLALEFFSERYPDSRYVREARTTLRFAERAIDDAERRRSITIGVLLPMSNDDISLTQSLFNGIRLAVDAHNASGDGATPVKMVFRQTNGADYDVLMREFAEMGSAVVIGPLYSRAAVSAAAVAERYGVTLVAPLATDERVAVDREHVFQANPTGTMRGRAIARFAVENLRHSKLGLITEDGNALSERMAEGFEDEVLRLGAEMTFSISLPSATGWFRLGDRLVADSLTGTQAVYLPITGGQARSLIKAAMDEFDNLDVPLRLLGNKEWHDLPSRLQPSRYNAVYTTDFRLNEDDARVDVFRGAYERLAESEPNELAYVGYDLAQYILYLLTAGSDQPLHIAFRQAAPYTGIALRLDFDGGNVNRAMFFQRYRNGQEESLY